MPTHLLPETGEEIKLWAPWHLNGDASATKLHRLYQNLFSLDESVPASGPPWVGIHNVQKVLNAYAEESAPTALYPHGDPPETLSAAADIDTFTGDGQTYSWDHIVVMLNDLLTDYNYDIDPQTGKKIPNTSNGPANLSSDQVVLLRRMLINQARNSRIAPFEANSAW